MQLKCPHCSRTLEITGDPPAFCAYCGLPLSGNKPLTTAEFDRQQATLPPADTPQPDDAEVPQVVGGYRLLRQIGRGGMGTVHEAEETATGRRVAVKLISRRFDASFQTFERFKQEGRLASRITHPRCVFVLAADEEAGQPYIVMELMPGATLQDVVEQGGPLPVEEALARILDVIEGLEEAHRSGVIHRDVKPSNCFIEEAGRVKIGDFGLSKALAQGAHLTRTGAFLGTPLYASPEQVRAERVDEQSDVYSVAATLYFLLTGRAPHQTADAAATLARIVSDPAPSMRTYRPDLPGMLDEVVARGLERDRADRWGSLAEFREALLPFVPGRLSMGGMGMRFGAYLFDAAILHLAAGVLGVSLAGAALSLVTRVRLQLGTQAVLAVLYFGILEGLWGASLGKRFLGLRIRTVAGNAMPGLARSLLRVAIWYSALSWASIPATLLISPQLAALESQGHVRGRPGEVGGIGFWPIVLPWIGYLSGAIGLFSTARARNGYRGLHEWASGTRVVALPWSHAGRPLAGRAFAEKPARPAGMPEQIGPFIIHGALKWQANDKVLVAEDAGLRRKVWLWLRPGDAPPLSVERSKIDRLARLRCLASGTFDGDQWHAFVAPTGCSLPDLIAADGKRNWPQARTVLEGLAEELSQACDEGTMPAVLTPAQVWIEPNGRIQLLDMPITDGTPAGKQLDQERALSLLAEVAVLILEGRESPTARGAGEVEAPVPRHAAAMLQRLFPGPRRFHDVREFHTALVMTRDKPREVTRPRRMATVAALAACVSYGLLLMFFMTLGLEIAGSLYLAHHAKTGDIALTRLREAMAGEVAAAVTQSDPLNRAAAVQNLHVDGELEHRLRDTVAYTQLEVRARETWLHPILRSGLLVTTADIGGESIEDVQRHRAQFREFANEEAGFRYSIDWDNITGWAIRILPLSIPPILWILWTFLTRGGLVLRFGGLSLVNSRGQPASRLRCAWRTLLVWLPITVLLFTAVQLEAWYWDVWQPGDPHVWAPWIFWASWWAALAMLLSYVVLALWFPVRGLHDGLAGTYVVPR